MIYNFNITPSRQERNKDDVFLRFFCVLKAYANDTIPDAPPYRESRRMYRRLCYIPLPQNRKFTGRGEVLQCLQKKLFEQPDCQKLAVVGLGGVGKTSVALRFAY